MIPCIIAAPYQGALKVSDLCGELHRVTASRFMLFRISIAFSQNASTSEVQGECGGKLAWPLLSRSLHSYSHLHCEYKGTKNISKKRLLKILFPIYFNHLLLSFLLFPPVISTKRSAWRDLSTLLEMTILRSNGAIPPIPYFNLPDSRNL